MEVVVNNNKGKNVVVIFLSDSQKNENEVLKLEQKLRYSGYISFEKF